MDTKKKNREHISTLADGALPKEDVELAHLALRTEDGQQAWEVYHRIGDVLRAEASIDLSPEFSARLAARLAAEPLHVRTSSGAEAGAVTAAVLAASSQSS